MRLAKLKAIDVTRTTKPGLHADGGGLYLQISASGAKSWTFRFMLRGKAREMGLGSLTAVGLAEARQKAADCRRQRQEGIDPIEARRAIRDQQTLEAAKSLTFSSAAATYIASHRAGWRNAKHVSQWANTLATYAEPIIGKIPVQAMDTALIMKVLEPIWTTKPETATRLRGRIERVLDWAKVSGFRTGENPARWRGHLDHLLAPRSKVRSVKHHSALAHEQMPDFVASLHTQEGVAAYALEFLILTVSRTGEALGATSREFNLVDKVWTIPGARMKAGREHRVPLCGRALEILKLMFSASVGQAEFVFPGGRPGKPLSNMAMTALLRRMKRGNVTVHGFRSTFRDWAEERTSYSREIIETALSHTVGDKVEAAYRRTDLLEKRRSLMELWSSYCAGQNVVL